MPIRRTTTCTCDPPPSIATWTSRTSGGYGATRRSRPRPPDFGPTSPPWARRSSGARSSPPRTSMSSCCVRWAIAPTPPTASPFPMSVRPRWARPPSRCWEPSSSRAPSPRVFDRPSVVVGVIAGVLASPVPYYVLYQPTMAHGVVFGLAGMFLWAWTEADRQPSAKHWARLGALLGLLALTRWQAIVYAALLLPLAVAGLSRHRVRPQWIAVAALCAFAVFVPQLVAWKVIYGRFLALPTRENAVDWSSPHLAAGAAVRRPRPVRMDAADGGGCPGPRPPAPALAAARGGRPARPRRLRLDQRHAAGLDRIGLVRRASIRPRRAPAGGGSGRGDIVLVRRPRPPALARAAGRRGRARGLELRPHAPLPQARGVGGRGLRPPVRRAVVPVSPRRRRPPGEARGTARAQPRLHVLRRRVFLLEHEPQRDDRHGGAGGTLSLRRLVTAAPPPELAGLPLGLLPEGLRSRAVGEPARPAHLRHRTRARIACPTRPWASP